MAGEALISVMREAAKGAIPPESMSDIMYGTVTSKSPLTINVEGRFDITESMVILSPFCYDKVVNIDLPMLSHNYGVDNIEIPAHSHKLVDEPDKATDESEAITITPGISIDNHPSSSIQITIWTGIQVGDKVALLRVAQGQQYIVLFKAGG